MLGYPARDSLRAWIHKFHPELRTRVAEQAAYAPVREGGAALDEAAVPGRRKAETASIRFLPQGDQSRAGKPRQLGLHGYCSE